jgi:hypothetical protein
MKRLFRDSACRLVVGFMCLLSCGFAQSTQQATNQPKAYAEKTFSLGEKSETILNVLSSTKGDITITDDENRGLGVVLPDKPEEAPFRVMALTCGSDLVVMGTPASGVSYLSANKRFVYTHWTVIVQKVLKNDPKAPIAFASVIGVDRAGGTLKVNGRQVRDEILGSPDFESGRPYLFYLKRIPDAKVYRADAEGSYEFSGEPVVAQGDDDPAKMMEETQLAVSLEAGKSAGEEWSNCSGQEGEE